MRLDEIIQNSVRQRLLEYAGVSDEVSGAAESLYDTILRVQENVRWEQLAETWPDGSPIFRKEMQFNNSGFIPFADVIWVFIYGYDPNVMDADDAYDNLKKAIPNFKNKFSQITHEVMLSIPWPSIGVWREKDKLIGTIGHELMHCWQNHNRGVGHYKSLAIKSNNAVEGPDIQSSMDYVKTSKDLAYYFDDDEMGAWIQGAWHEAPRYGGIEKTPSWGSLKNAIALLEEFEENVDILKKLCDYRNDRSDFLKVNDYFRKQYNMPLKKFLYVMRNKGARLRQAMMKLKYRWMEENGQGGTGNFSKYASGEIENNVRFNQRNRNWKDKVSDIVNWLRKSLTNEEKIHNNMKKNTMTLTESDIHEFVNRVARRLVREDVLGNNWHEADGEEIDLDDVANNYEPFDDQLKTGDNFHDQSIVGDRMDPTIYEEAYTGDEPYVPNKYPGQTPKFTSKTQYQNWKRNDAPDDWFDWKDDRKWQRTGIQPAHSGLASSAKKARANGQNGWTNDARYNQFQYLKQKNGLGESRVIRMTESDLMSFLNESVRKAVNKRLNESNELYDEWYDEEDYDGNVGEPGLIKSYDIGSYYTSQAEQDAEENGMSLEDYLLYWFDEIKQECPWYWTQKSGGYYKTLAQQDGVVIKELPGDQIVIDEYPIGDAGRDEAMDNRMPPGDYSVE